MKMISVGENLKSESLVPEWIIQSNLIESVDNPLEHLRSYSAWQWLMRQTTLDINNVLKLHSKIMYAYNKKIAGRLRTCDIWVGRHKGTPPEEVMYELTVLCRTINSVNRKGKIKQWHIDFEKIHPFEDGNGRTGRMIMNWQREKQANMEPLNLTYESRHDYYDWFESPGP